MAATIGAEENTPGGSSSKKEQILMAERDEFPSNDVDNEKGNVPHVEHHIVLRDGVVLHPQPTADALDPLNWSACKTNSILAIVKVRTVPIFSFFFRLILFLRMNLRLQKEKSLDILVQAIYRAKFAGH